MLDEYTQATLGSKEFQRTVDEVHAARFPGAFSSDEPTPYENSEECGSILEQDLMENPDSLHGTRMPHYALKREKFEHRMVIFLKAQGLSNKEIAEKTGYTPVSVSNIVRQPWAQQRILEEMNSAGRDQVQTMLQGAAVDAVQRLISEMDNPEARASERIQAADKLLDRLYGKPNQPITQRTDLQNLSDDDLAKIVSSGTVTKTS